MSVIVSVGERETNGGLVLENGMAVESSVCERERECECVCERERER